MVERDDLADIDDTGPWEREDEEASKEDVTEDDEAATTTARDLVPGRGRSGRV